MHELSIITINLNNAAGLQQTVESVFRQRFTDFEYIIIDGRSTDGSKEIIEKNASKLAYWVSEKDTGIYNAMNKGIVKSKGEYLLFLNSGDYLFNENTLTEFFENGSHADIIYGNAILEKGRERTKWELPEKLSFRFFLHSSLPHAGSLIKRSLFEKTGQYNECYKIVSDWEFFLLAVHKYQCSYIHIPVTGVIYNFDGISAKEENKRLIQEEKEAVLQQHFASFLTEYEHFQKMQDEFQSVKRGLAYRVYNKLSRIFRTLFKR